jgi:Ankyrin repeats (many copies)
MSCNRCRHQHTTESCVIDSSIEGELDKSDVFMFGPIDMRIILLLTTEVWQLLLSYLPVRDVIPALPLTNKYLNDEVVWGKWSGPLLWGGMVGIDSGVFKLFTTKKNSPMQTVLIRACTNGAPVSHVSSLLKGRANMHYNNSFIMPAIYTACQNGHVHVVETLLAFKCDLNVISGSVSDLTTLCAASNSVIGANVVKFLIERGANVNLKDRHGNTPLMFAAFSDNPESMRILIDAHADVNARKDDGRSALDIAVRFGSTECVQLLLLLLNVLNNQ